MGLHRNKEDVQETQDAKWATHEKRRSPKCTRKIKHTFNTKQNSWSWRPSNLQVDYWTIRMKHRDDVVRLAFRRTQNARTNSACLNRGHANNALPLCLLRRCAHTTKWSNTHAKNIRTQTYSGASWPSPAQISYSAFCSKRSFTIPSLFVRAASCNGVNPSLSLSRTSAFHSTAKIRQYLDSSWLMAKHFHFIFILAKLRASKEVLTEQSRDCVLPVWSWKVQRCPAITILVVITSAEILTSQARKKGGKKLTADFGKPWFVRIRICTCTEGAAPCSRRYCATCIRPQTAAQCRGRHLCGATPSSLMSLLSCSRHFFTWVKQPGHERGCVTFFEQASGLCGLGIILWLNRQLCRHRAKDVLGPQYSMLVEFPACLQCCPWNLVWLGEYCCFPAETAWTTRYLCRCCWLYRSWSAWLHELRKEFGNLVRVEVSDRSSFGAWQRATKLKADLLPATIPLMRSIKPLPPSFKFRSGTGCCARSRLFRDSSEVDAIRTLQGFTFSDTVKCGPLPSEIVLILFRPAFCSLHMRNTCHLQCRRP